jgi:LuxR family maltose regulon positive regulatory protein
MMHLAEAATLADLAASLGGVSGVAKSPVWPVLAALLHATASDATGDAESAERWLERALDLAEPQGLLLPFLLLPSVDLLDRHSRRRTAHGALVRQILDTLGAGRRQVQPDAPRQLPEPLSASETRVLRFLPTNLSAAEIARELYVSVNTIKTHMRNLYSKLGAHGRTEAVEKARALGLLAPRSGQVSFLRDRAAHAGRSPVDAGTLGAAAVA